MEKCEKIIEKASDEKKQQDFYKKLRKKVHNYVEEHPNSKYTEYLLLVPDFFHLLCRLLADSRVPFKNKALIAAAITYFISPLDIIIDLIPGIGLIDDVYLTTYVLKSLLDSVGEEVIIELWAGDGDVLALIKQVFDFAEEYAGKGVLNKILKFLKREEKCDNEK